MSRHGRRHSAADGTVIVEIASAEPAGAITVADSTDLAETIEALTEPVAEVATPAVVKRYAPKPGELTRVDYMGRRRPLERKA